MTSSPSTENTSSLGPRPTWTVNSWDYPATRVTTHLRISEAPGSSETPVRRPLRTGHYVCPQRPRRGWKWGRVGRGVSDRTGGSFTVPPLVRIPIPLRHASDRTSTLPKTSLSYDLFTKPSRGGFEFRSPSVRSFWTSTVRNRPRSVVLARSHHCTLYDLGPSTLPHSKVLSESPSSSSTESTRSFASKVCLRAYSLRAVRSHPHSPTYPPTDLQHSRPGGPFRQLPAPVDPLRHPRRLPPRIGVSPVHPFPVHKFRGFPPLPSGPHVASPTFAHPPTLTTHTRTH